MQPGVIQEKSALHHGRAMALQEEVMDPLRKAMECPKRYLREVAQRESKMYRPIRTASWRNFFMTS